MVLPLQRDGHAPVWSMMEGTLHRDRTVSREGYDLLPVSGIRRMTYWKPSVTYKLCRRGSSVEDFDPQRH